MKKYNIETVYNYMNGEDITDFTLKELESNTNFMIDVINVSNDKNFYDFAEESVKTDYRFVKFIINKFKEDENLITVAADTYIESQDNEQNYIELLIIMCNLVKDKKDKNYKKYKFLLEANYSAKRLQIELGKLKIDKEASDNLGMGFLSIYDSFNSSQIILDYYAKAIIEDIFEEYDIVLEDISKQLNEIKNNWNKYIEIKERTKCNEILNKVHEYMEYEAVDYYSLNETTLLYLVATNLGIEKTLLKYDSISEEYYQGIMEEAHFLLEVSELSFNDRLNYNNIKKIILDILKDTQSSSQTLEAKTENNKKCKIIKLVKNEQRD